MITTIKFLATDVAPRPDEVDYWVDITDNPYKGTIKYFNGTDWIRLQDLGGNLDLTKCYSKSEVIVLQKLLNIKVEFSGTGYVYEQSIKAGDKFKPGETIKVRLKEKK